MRDADKPFVLYKHGWSMSIKPRGIAGWLALLPWVLVLTLAALAFIVFMSSEPSNNAATAFGIIYGIFVLGWIVAFIRWTKARSEIVDFDELLVLKRQRDREANKRQR
jgi:Na+/H+ antiporter NhaC